MTESPLSRIPAPSDIESVLNVRPNEYTLDKSVYEVDLAEAGTGEPLLTDRLGKVTLLFNVAAGCGNIPQHQHLQYIHHKYLDNPLFDVIAVVVDDFTCHGYPEFSNGLQEYIDVHELDCTPGELSRDYGSHHYGTTFRYSELTAGRIDKHVYDPKWVPNGEVLQDLHPLWKLLTGYDIADIRPDGVPYHDEYVPWVNSPLGPPENSSTAVKRRVQPITGNFTKFLIDKTGTKVKRFGNGFLTGERDALGKPFPWWPQHYTEGGAPSHKPRKMTNLTVDKLNKQFGIKLSCRILSSHVDEFISE